MKLIQSVASLKNLQHNFPKMRGGVQGRLELFRKFIRFGGGRHPSALEDFESESFWENVLLLVSVVCLSHSLSVVLLTSLFLFLGSCLVSLGLLGFSWDVC